MTTQNYIIIFGILIIIGIFYIKYTEKHSYITEEDNFNAIKAHILDDSSLITNNKNKKPIIWIHVPYEYNSRNWESFGSRSSFELNQPYLYLTVKTIIKNCDESFIICIIDDKSFKKLIPNWNIDMSLLSEPMISYIRQMALMKLIYTYGGMNLPISFLAFKDLYPFYKKYTRNNKMFIGENIDYNITSTHNDFFPNIGLVGANKHNQTIGELIEFMQRIISTDNTNQSEFLGEFDRWCNKRVEIGKINIVNGKYIGTKTLEEDPVLIEQLLGEDYIDFYRDMEGIWIPDKIILKRRYFEWFARLSEKQVVEGNFILAKYILLALAPDSHLGVIEPLVSKPDWVSFWKVPSGAPIWGLKPYGLGNYVPKSNY